MHKSFRWFKKVRFVGDIIVISVKDAIPKGMLKGAVHKVVVVRTRKEI